MIDKIKIVIPAVKASRKYLGKPYAKYSRSTGEVKKYKLFFGEGKQENEPFISVEINEEKCEVSVNGSLRKWASSKFHGSSDLTKARFDFCLEKISLKLDIPLEKIHEATVTQVEIGASIKMKSAYRNILSCVDNFPKLKKETFEVDSEFVKNTKELETLYFRGQNYSLMFYDKLAEIYSDKEKKKALLKKMSKAVYILRYEIKVKKVSGYILKEKLNTIEKIRENWNIIIDHWIGRLDELSFIDNLSAENVHYKKEMSLTELKELLIYQGISAMKWKNVRILINDYVRANKASDHRKQIKKIWESHRGIEKRDYPEILKTEISNRGKKLKFFL